MKTSKQRILVFRFSAMGDVAMTVPVLKELTTQNTDIELIIVSKELFKPFFSSIPNSIFIGVNLDHYKGILGLKRLAGELKKYKPTAIADLHNVLRTKILKLFLSFYIKKKATLDKGRKEKKILIKKQNKVLKPLQSMHERYADVFRKLGYSIKLSNQLPLSKIKRENFIGIAPFANYKEKMYPLEKMKDICLKLAEKNYKIFLLGGGKEEADILNEWCYNNSNIQSLADKISIEKQMEIIESLQFIISMDSANMHIASLVGTRVISIWGATHPFAGFLGYGQKNTDIIQINLDCRPCSIFGNKPCYRKDWACMVNIIEDNILNKIDISFSK